jgi:2-dehydro-3-deoxygalactonokinase
MPTAASPSGEAGVTAARLIALDWGSTRLRGWLLGDGGAVLAERSSADGASQLTGGAAAFDAALQALAGDWLALNVPVLACGMVGSAHGWREAPYVPCPVALDRLHEHCATLTTAGGALLRIVPGLIDDPADGTPDVMRGEETQLVGLLALDPSLASASTVLLPGTHSKWATLRAGRVTGFRTRMTGELFALLRQHSVLARLMPVGAGDAHWRADAFDAGVDSARRGDGRDLGGQLFAVRTLGLTGRWPGDALPDLLSGLLIGHELVAGLAACGNAPLALVGESALCRRYERALQAFGVAPAVVQSNTATAGLWHLAQQPSKAP